MKTTRIVILLAVISLFTTSPYLAAEARDCSNPEGFHEKLMCKMKQGKEERQDSGEKTGSKCRLAYPHRITLSR